MLFQDLEDISLQYSTHFKKLSDFLITAKLWVSITSSGFHLKMHKIWHKLLYKLIQQIRDAKDNPY